MELLDVWEAGQTLSPVQRALALLTAALPDVSDQALADMPIGRRDAELLSLREHLFGSLIVALADCPNCSERCELTFEAEDIRMTHPFESLFEIQADGYSVRARPANSLDLMAVHTMDPAAPKERAIIANCTIEARHGDSLVGPDELPDAVAEAVAHAMSEADPQADVRMAMDCPACGHQWRALFDVAAFLWREIDAWAKRSLNEVHAVASAYGWSQRDILSMSASRRRRYVSMIAQVP
jgi:hypothetical protein